MKQVLRFIHTVRYLKLKQVAYRLYYRLRKPAFKKEPVPTLRHVLQSWPAPAFMQPATKDGTDFCFLGAHARLDGDWNDPAFPKLWLYNLHYQDDLNARGADGRFTLCQQLVDEWISGNPAVKGNGWEPYCISLRVVNWIKWLSRLKPEKFKERWLESLANQIDVLDQQIEHHILANHLFANAKALVFGGAFFAGKKGEYWLGKGLKLLDQEIEEQFLPDGGHFELSPMYHAILLWDLADLICLQQNSQIPELEQKAVAWKRCFLAGFQWLQAMVHPDQQLSFFNDTTLGVSPTLDDLRSYATALDIDVSSLPVKDNQLCGQLHLDSGYVVIDAPEQHRLIADVGQVGPDYQPGHAHADTLSCELSLFGLRVLVNSGISRYGDDVERHRQRSTAAHNTLEVNGENSSEVWAGFRVARRAKPFGLEFNSNAEQIYLSASHDGYKRLSGGATHTREWLVEKTALTITDKIIGHTNQVIVYWHMHPEVKLDWLGENHYNLALSNGKKVSLSISGADSQICDSTWHPGFGKSVNNNKLVLKLTDHGLITRLEWSSD